MISAVLRPLVAAALIWATASGALAQQPPRPPLVVKQVKPELFMVIGAGGNTTVRVTPDGLVVVDSKNPGQPIFDDLMTAIHAISPLPVRWLVDTHMHADHTGNNGRFLAAGAKVVGQKNLALGLAKFTPPTNNPTAQAPATPDVTYETAYTIKEGGKTVRLLHFTPAHTDGDTIVYFPDLKVVAMGDELVANTPNFDYGGGASIVGWMNALDQVLKLDWDLAIPGHGADPLTRADMVAFKTKLATFLERARAEVKAGAPKDQLIARMKTDDLWTFAPNAWSQPGRLDGLYAEAGGK